MLTKSELLFVKTQGLDADDVFDAKGRSIKDVRNNGRLPVGYRAGGRTVIAEFRPSPLHRAGGGPRWGTPVAGLWPTNPLDARPLD
ncbi:hypothetical protein J2Z31_002794 [Sinorhizobium kostiense]|uniref:DUF4224 domain-containing protein n=1 Tax=Sinorhizobium kostiense TaxID=76747 RepID=A0ABS4R1Y5_9HYPH|nr:hypothetical protein [Sinorhizobium kostiense]